MEASDRDASLPRAICTIEVADDEHDRGAKRPIARDADRTRTEDGELADVVVEEVGPSIERVEVEHARGFAFAAARAGAPLDLAKVAALVGAVDALLTASLIDQARPLVRELRAHVEAAQGPRAAVLDLRAERSKRRES